MMEDRIYKIGESTCVRTIHGDDYKTKLEIVVDQDKFKGKCG